MSPEALDSVAEKFKILPEPLHLGILQSLETVEMSVGEITGAVESTQPNISRHLRILQDAGLISRRQEGNKVYYGIADETIFALCDAVCANLKERHAARSAIFG